MLPEHYQKIIDDALATAPATNVWVQDLVIDIVTCCHALSLDAAQARAQEIGGQK